MPRRARTVFHYKVDHTLDPSNRMDYERLLNDPRTTIDSAHAWLLSRGHRISRSAVARHRRRLLQSAQAVTQAAALARAFAGATDDIPPDKLTLAALLRHQQLILNQLMDVQSSEQLTSTQLLDLVRALAHAIKAHRDLLEMKREFPDARPPETSTPRDPPANQLLYDKVRQVLGEGGLGEGGREGTEARRHEGTEARRHGGTEARRDGGEERHEGT